MLCTTEDVCHTTLSYISTSARTVLALAPKNVQLTCGSILYSTSELKWHTVCCVLLRTSVIPQFLIFPPVRRRSSHCRSKAYSWCRQKSRTLCRRNVQSMQTIFLRLTKILQRENCKYVDFNDPTPVWRRSYNKRLRISANDLYCQKLDLLTYIFAGDSIGLYISFHAIIFESRTSWV